MAQRDVFVLPVVEIENILLLPSVFLALAKALACEDPHALLEKLTDHIIAQAIENADIVSARYAVRQIDRRLKRVEINARSLSTLQTEYNDQLAAIDPPGLFTNFKNELLKEANNRNVPRLLELYDNKGLLAAAASLLGIRDQKRLIEKVGRLLGNGAGGELKEELTRALPNLGAVTTVAHT